MLGQHKGYIANTLSSKVVAKWYCSEYTVSVKKWVTSSVQVKAPATNQNNNLGDLSSVCLLREEWRYWWQQRLDKKIDNYVPNMWFNAPYLKVQLGINAVYKSVMHCRSCHAN